MRKMTDRISAFAGHQPGTDDMASVRLAYASARDGSEELLKAQLRHGQHILPIARARTVGARLGMHPLAVRPAFGDPTIHQGAKA
jgi:hypothetical protein